VWLRHKFFVCIEVPSHQCLKRCVKRLIALAAGLKWIRNGMIGPLTNIYYYCAMMKLSKVDSVIRDRLIYWPGRYIRLIVRFHRYIGIGQNSQFYRPQWMLTKHHYILHASRQLAHESTKNQVKTVSLHQR